MRTTPNLAKETPHLWDVIWENRDEVIGFAHSHPGSGIPGPSYTDITTFAAVEAALGKNLNWWITSADKLVSIHWVGPKRFDYNAIVSAAYPLWLPRLREESKYQIIEEV
jgi:proteasome lid subunit RPN8/RPN11